MEVAHSSPLSWTPGISQISLLANVVIQGFDGYGLYWWQDHCQFRLDKHSSLPSKSVSKSVTGIKELEDLTCLGSPP